MYLHFAANLYPVGDPYRHTIIMRLAYSQTFEFFLEQGRAVRTKYGVGHGVGHGVGVVNFPKKRRKFQ